jgi:hypothetical protein
MAKIANVVTASKSNSKPAKVQHKVINKIKPSAKPSTKPAAKAEKPVAKVLKPQKSISRIVFGYIASKNLLDSDNRKAAFDELLNLVKKDFPESKFQKTHFFWYLSRAAKQKEHGLGLDHLVTIKKEEEAA